METNPDENGTDHIAVKPFLRGVFPLRNETTSARERGKSDGGNGAKVGGAENRTRLGTAERRIRIHTNNLRSAIFMHSRATTHPISMRCQHTLECFCKRCNRNITLVKKTKFLQCGDIDIFADDTELQKDICTVKRLFVGIELFENLNRVFRAELQLFAERRVKINVAFHREASEDKRCISQRGE